MIIKSKKVFRKILEEFCSVPLLPQQSSSFLAPPDPPVRPWYNATYTSYALSAVPFLMRVIAPPKCFKITLHGLLRKCGSIYQEQNSFLFLGFP
jgi:hypothetical protein